MEIEKYLEIFKTDHKDNFILPEGIKEKLYVVGKCDICIYNYAMKDGSLDMVCQNKSSNHYAQTIRGDGCIHYTGPVRTRMGGFPCKQ